MKVAVIGAGASGLASIKACLEEGLQVTCFEKENTIGGLWNYTETMTHSSVMRSTIINTSKQMMSFTDFPIPHDFPNFMHNTKVMEYLYLYANEFNLTEHIKFTSVVINVSRVDDFAVTGRWKVEWAPLGKEINGSQVDIFDAVMLCTGHHWKQNWPVFEGMDIFEGKQIHSKMYKDTKGYENQTVLCVGIGNSGGDISCELSRCAKEVYLSTRRGCWVMSRHGIGGLPMDHAITRFTNSLPLPIVRYVLETVSNLNFDHKKFGLQPTHGLFSQHPMVNDDLPIRISSGTLKIKPNVKKLTKTGVIFSDDSRIDHIDTIIYCTGYQISFPVLENNNLINVENNQFDLYKLMFVPELKHQTLAVLGVFQPIGALFPIVDLQARLAVKVFTKKVCLPGADMMLRDIDIYKKSLSNEYYDSKRHTIQVQVLPYSDDLAKLIGCRPNILKMCLTDPKLAWHCFFGPLYPQQYRLTGSHTWSKAREYILTAHRYIFTQQQQQRLDAGVNNSDDPQPVNSDFWSNRFVLFCLLLVGLFFAVIVRHVFDDSLTL